MEFQEIYKIYSPKIFRICLHYFDDEDKAKDLTQETFITVWEGLKNFRGESKMGTWIYRIATNKCLRQINIDKKNSKTDLPENISNPEFPIEKEEKLIFLQKCIAELPEIDRILIGLFMEDVPQEKIAEIVGISHTNVRVKIHRIKEKLTEKFRKNEQL